MKKVTFFLLLVFTLCASSNPPTMQEAKNFLDFFHNGQTPVLAEALLCDDVQKNQCQNQTDANQITAGKKYMVWMAFVVPQTAGEQNISIKLLHNSTEIWEKKLKVRSSIYYRTWKSVKATKPGQWSLEIFHNKDGKPSKMHTIPLTVQ